MHLKDRSKKIIIIEFALLILLGIFQIISFSYGKIGITAIIAALIVITPPNKRVIILFTALPFFNLFNLHMRSTSYYYIFIIIFLLGSVGQLKPGHRYKYLVFIALICVRLTSKDIGAMFRWAMLISVFFVTYMEDSFVENIKEIVRALSISMILSSGFGLYMMNNDMYVYGQGYIYHENENTIRFAGLIGDSVFFAQFIAVLVAANLVIAFYDKKSMKTNIIISAVLSAFCIYSYAKTGILLLVLCVILFAVATTFKSGKDKRVIRFSMIGILIWPVGICLVWYYIKTHADNAVISDYILRFSDTDLLTGRQNVAHYYIELLKSQSTSFFSAMDYTLYTGGVHMSRGYYVYKTHNIYLELVCAFGLITAVIILIWLIAEIIKTIRRKQGVFMMLPLFILILSGFVLHGIFEFPYYTLLSIAMAFLHPDAVKIISGKAKN